MKKPSDDLFSLIKSLTPSEKGYFKKYASLHNSNGDNNYLKLYEIMNKSEIYDEELVKATYKDEKFIKHLWVIKKYLYETLLKSLQEYHGDKQIESQLNDTYNNIQVLFRKGLYDQCTKQLKKAKEICEEHEIYTFLLKFLSFEKKLLNSDQFSQKSDKDIEKHHKEIITATEKIKYSNEYQFNSSKLFLLIKEKGSVKSTRDLQDLKKIMNQPIYKSLKYAMTDEMKLSYYKAHFYYNYLKRDHQQTFKNSEKLLKMYEAAHLKLKARPKTYLSYINNHLDICITCNKFSEFEKYLKEYRNLCTQIDDVNNSFYISSLNLELNYYLKSYQYEKAIELSKEIISTIAQNDSRSNEIIKNNIYYNLAYLFFAVGDYSKSLDYVNRLIHSRLKDDIEVLYYARILNLIIHFEMGNILHLEYILKSTFRYLFKRNRVFKFEKIMYDYIRKAFNLNNDAALKRSFIELRGRLKEIAKDPFENAAFDYIDIISWLESKMTGKSFAETVKSKVENSKIQKSNFDMKKLSGISNIKKAISTV